ncbi:MAG: hypothetical protein K8F30_01445 [Taibaiella sp.]|nr:hypothetical protein [Taibaiella sp.]
MNDKIVQLLKAISESSKTYEGWTLLVIGGTILTILSSDYIKPTHNRARIIYLLFIPGWISFSISLFKADYISRAAIGATMSTDLSGLFKDIDKAYGDQLSYFKGGLLFIVLWLILFVIIWIFEKDKTR